MNGWSDPILNIALFDNKSRSSPITALLATDKPPSVCKEPSVVLVASVVLLTFIIPVGDTVAAVEEPIVVTPDPLANVVACEELKVPPITVFFTTDKPPSVCKEPSLVVVASVVLLIFIIPVAETVAAVEEPIVVTPSMLPM